MEIPSFLTDYADYLRDLSQRHSEERREFAVRRIEGQKDYVANLTRFSPYIHFDEWDKHN